MQMQSGFWALRPTGQIAKWFGLADRGNDLRRALYGQREVGQRRNAHQREFARFGQHAFDQVADGVVLCRAQRLRQRGAAKAVVTVPVTGLANRA